MENNLNEKPLKPRFTGRNKIIAVVLCISLVSGVFYLKYRAGIRTNSGITNGDTDIEGTQNSKGNENNNNETNGPAANGDDTQNGGESEENTGGENNNPTSGKPGQPGNAAGGSGQMEYSYLTDPLLTPYWQQIDAIASCAHTYYAENFGKTRIISKNGYLYNIAADFYINVEYLYESEGLSVSYRYSDAKVLLLYGGDLDNFESLKISGSDTDLTPFVALKHPTENKYMIASLNSPGGVLTGAEYANMIAGYSQNHGVVRRIYQSAADYDRIIGFIKLYESNLGNYYVRSVTVDDKYALVCLSDNTNTANVKQYILKNNNNVWEVVMDGIENEPRPIIAVNKEIPDFNLNMLPNYTIYDFRNSIMTSYGDIAKIMIANNYIGNLNDIYYISGAGNFCYLVTETGVKYLCIYRDGIWLLQRIASSYDAQALMSEEQSSAPLFILLDD